MWLSLTIPYWRLTIVPYDVARIFAEIVSVLLVLALNRRQGMSVYATASIAIVGVPVGCWGARLLDIAEYGSEYPSVTAALGRNGSSIYGAFFATFLVVLIVGRLLRVSVLKFLDAAGPALALGEAISRLGCFCAGCCYGVPWNGPWAVSFPVGSFAFYDLRARGILLDASASGTPPLHPVQLYATALMLVVTVALVWRFSRRAHDGEVFALFLIAYGAERLLLAPFRMEALASMKVFSVLFIVAGMTGCALARRVAPLRWHSSVAHMRAR